MTVRAGSRVLLCLVLLVAAHPASSQVIKMGTLAPEGSPWHDVLLQIREDWREISGGKVTLRIYPGGVLGDEKHMIRRVRIRQLHAVAITGSGLATIEPAISALQVPLMFDSYEELDYVRERLAPKLEDLLEEKGFKVLNWGDAGWVHFFAKQPFSTLDELRGLKLLTAAGDPKTEALYKDFGFNVVPLAYTDVLTSLQTGMIDVVQGPPLYALIEQWFGLASHMVDLRWAPLVGATLVWREAWDRIRPEWRKPMLEAARNAGDRLRDDIRRLGEEAVPEMQKRGLVIVPIDGERLAEWRTETLAAYPKLRGTYAPAEMFDEALRLRDEYRAARSPQQKVTLP